MQIILGNAYTYDVMPWTWSATRERIFARRPSDVAEF